MSSIPLPPISSTYIITHHHRVIPHLKRFLHKTGYWVKIFPLLVADHLGLESLVAAVIEEHNPIPYRTLSPSTNPSPSRPGHANQTPTQSRQGGTQVPETPRINTSPTQPPGPPKPGISKPPNLKYSTKTTLNLLRYCASEGFTDLIPQILEKLLAIVKAEFGISSNPRSGSEAETKDPAEIYAVWMNLISDVLEKLPENCVPEWKKLCAGIWGDVPPNRILPGVSGQVIDDGKEEGEEEGGDEKAEEGEEDEDESAGPEDSGPGHSGPGHSGPGHSGPEKIVPKGDNPVVSAGSGHAGRKRSAEEETERKGVKRVLRRVKKSTGR